MATSTAPLESAQTLRQTNSTTAPGVKPARRPHNAVWFEIPVRNLDRAMWFYEAAFGFPLKVDSRFPGLAIFPRGTNDSVTGALIQSDLVSPSTHGTVVYLNCDGDLDGVVKRALMNGAKLLTEVAQLPGGMGFIAEICDPDGNRVGLHAAF
jgi:predicted enzyme related to lactoylglutathione lyase